jgi:hypothetical protein
MDLYIHSPVSLRGIMQVYPFKLMGEDHPGLTAVPVCSTAHNHKEEADSSIFLRSVRRLLVTANVIPM